MSYSKELDELRDLIKVITGFSGGAIIISINFFKSNYTENLILFAVLTVSWFCFLAQIFYSFTIISRYVKTKSVDTNTAKSEIMGDSKTILKWMRLWVIAGVLFLIIFALLISLPYFKPPKKQENRQQIIIEHRDNEGWHCQFNENIFSGELNLPSGGKTRNL